jgi:hypothetical protein
MAPIALFPCADPLIVLLFIPFSSQPATDDALIRRIDINTRTVTTIAGNLGYFGRADGVGSNAQFSGAVGVGLDAAGTFALIVSRQKTPTRHCTAVALPSF